MSGRHTRLRTRAPTRDQRHRWPRTPSGTCRARRPAEASNRTTAACRRRRHCRPRQTRNGAATGRRPSCPSARTTHPPRGCRAQSAAGASRQTHGARRRRRRWARSGATTARCPGCPSCPGVRTMGLAGQAGSGEARSVFRPRKRPVRAPAGRCRRWRGANMIGCSKPTGGGARPRERSPLLYDDCRPTRQEQFLDKVGC